MTVHNLHLNRNITIYPWFKFFQSLLFWQAIWFLYFQNKLSAADAILLYAIYDIGTVVLEVPSGYLSDRVGRRFTLLCSALAGFAGTALLITGDSFAAFALGQILLGTSAAFASGTDSALLYESLSGTDRDADVEEQELKAWRFSFVALALSALIGGGLAVWWDVLPFIASLLSCAVVIALVWQLHEPNHSSATSAKGTELARLGTLKTAFQHPVLVWLFVISMLMYGFSHIPFVFGQPFILESLEAIGLQGNTPLVSGTISALMMGLAVLTSLKAPWLRQKIGLGAMVVLAFALQVGLCLVLALTNSVLAVAFLFLRMVPDALSRPFIIARTQPLLDGESRATYMSLQSFAGRILFAITLYLSAGAASSTGQMSYGEIQTVLGWYVLGGLACLLALSASALRIKIDTAR